MGNFYGHQFHAVCKSRRASCDCFWNFGRGNIDKNPAKSSLSGFFIEKRDFLCYTIGKLQKGCRYVL